MYNTYCVCMCVCTFYFLFGIHWYMVYGIHWYMVYGIHWYMVYGIWYWYMVLKLSEKYTYTKIICDNNFAHVHKCVFVSLACIYMTTRYIRWFLNIKANGRNNLWNRRKDRWISDDLCDDFPQTISTSNRAIALLSL